MGEPWGRRRNSDFIVAASDFDHAVWIGRMIPVADGWVEVRPVLTH